MRRRAVIAALGTGVASGCLRLSDPPEEEPGDPTQTGTAAEPGTQTTAAEGTQAPTDTPEPAEYPTGLDGDGVSLLLVDNHLSRLAGATYTRELTRTNVTDARLYEDVAVAVGDGVALYHFRRRNTDRYVELSAGGYFREAWRTVSNGVDVYGNLDICCVGRPENLLDHRYLRRIIGSAAFDPPSPTGDGFEIAASSVATPEPLRQHYEAEEVTDLRVAGRVTSEGVIRSLTTSVQIVTGDDLRQIDGEYAVTDVGSTSVETPGWVATARDRGPQISASRRDDGLGITYTHEGGDAVPAASRVGLHLHGEEGIAPSEYSSLAAAFEPGDTLTAFVERDGVGHARGSTIPGDAAPAELPSEGWADLTFTDGVAPFYKQAFRDL